MSAPQAVIEIGSTGIRLLVAEPVEESLQRKFNVLDRSEQPVNLGRDVFTGGSVSRETLEVCIRILERYGEQLSSWGVSREETIVIATSAVREAKNRDIFLDRIKLKTGFTAAVVDGIEESRLMYLAAMECIKEDAAIRQSDSIFLDISGGGTEMMLMENGRIVGAHSMRLGTVIIEQTIHSMLGNLEDARRIIGEFIRNTKKTLNAEMDLNKIQQFIVLGNDMKIASLFAGKAISPFLWEMEREAFEKFADEVQHYTIEECIAKFKMSYNDARTFQISLVAYKLFIGLTRAKKFVVPDTSIREGILLSQNQIADSEVQDDFTQQILAGARALLKKYQGDINHAEYVRKMSLSLYKALYRDIEFGPQTQTLLEVSAILHDIGMFIRNENHHIHGKYIVENSEIFGLNLEEKDLAAMIVSFHKGRARPQDDHEFMLLPRAQRMKVLKLSAIIRVADALDRTHKQPAYSFNVSPAKNTVTFRARGYSNLSLEKMAVSEKGDLFEDIFGYKIVLV